MLSENGFVMNGTLAVLDFHGLGMFNFLLLGDGDL